MTIKGGTTSKTLHSGRRLAAIDTIIARQGCGAGMGCIGIAKYRLGHATFPTVGFIIKALTQRHNKLPCTVPRTIQKAGQNHEACLLGVVGKCNGAVAWF